MRLKIVSDGTPPGTKLVDADTGAEVQNVCGLRWSLQAGELSRATVELDYIEFDGEGDTE